MSYVIAAYAIVLGSLTLYAVYLYFERVQLQHVLDLRPDESIPEGNFGFNVGAALLAPLWLLAHGRIGFGLVLLALNVATGFVSTGASFLVALAVSLVVFVYVGVNGNRIAQQHKRYPFREQLAADQKKWVYLGIFVTFLAYLPLLTIFSVALLAS